jgi:hypothetical protein
LAAAGLPPAVSAIVPLGPAPAVMAAAPAVEPVCAQAVNVVPARNATVNIAHREVCHITFSRNR